MSTHHRLSLPTLLGATFAAALLVSTGNAAASGPIPAHPAMPPEFVGTAIDTDHFLVQPPASVRWTVRHANGEHPAVLVQRQAPHVDTNAYRVQPPASVHWEVRDLRQAEAVAAAR